MIPISRLNSYLLRLFCHRVAEGYEMFPFYSCASFERELVKEFEKISRCQ